MSNNLIMSWLSAKKSLDDAKAAEMTLRETLVETYSDKRESGTENIPANGGNIKIVSAIEYKCIDPSVTDQRQGNKRKAVDEALRAIAALSPEGGFIAERLIKWVPELSVSEYKKLNAQQKALIDRVIETKPKAPQVSFEKDEPKG